MNLKVLSWNVEQFGKEDDAARLSARIGRVIDVILSENPDVFAILEVVGSTVFERFTEDLREYHFFITEGDQSQEILVGVRRELRVFVTQKDSFKESNRNLRPGLLVTVTSLEGQHLSILVNHLKSLTEPSGFGLRTSMLESAQSLAKSIRNRALALGQPFRFMVIGDLNTMGLDLTDSQLDITAAQELTRLQKRFGRQKMRFLSKTFPATWMGGSGSTLAPSDLDHVIASSSLSFADQGGAEVKVGGWALLGTQDERDAWIASYSDHCPISVVVTNF